MAGRRFPGGRRGFTFLEVMLTVGIIAIITASVGALLKGNIGLFHQKEEWQEAAQESRQAVARFLELARRQNNLELRTEGGASRVYGDGGLLLFCDGSLADGESCELFYEAAAGRLWKTEAGGTSHLLAEGLAAFSVKEAGDADRLLLRVRAVTADGYELVTEVRKAKREVAGGGAAP